MERAIRNFTLISILYLTSMGAGTALSIAQHLPARAAGILHSNARWSGRVRTLVGRERPASSFSK